VLTVDGAPVLSALAVGCDSQSSFELCDQEWIAGGETAHSSGAASTGQPDAQTSLDRFMSVDGGGSSAGGNRQPLVTSWLQDGTGLSDFGAERESCRMSLEVPGSNFSTTYTNNGSGPRRDADPAKVSSFRLDKCLVTAGRFRTFYAAWKEGTVYYTARGSGKHSQLNGGRGLENVANPGADEHDWYESDNANVAPYDGYLFGEPGATWTRVPGSDEGWPMNCVTWAEVFTMRFWQTSRSS
jgi:formylglycine-generating enzyme required for sulfatase activity